VNDDFAPHSSASAFASPISSSGSAPLIIDREIARQGIQRRIALPQDAVKQH
jgi:hypothetical protein